MLNETEKIELTFESGPGGRCEDIMIDWNLTAIKDNGLVTISGTKNEVNGFAEDYGLEHLLDENL